MKGKLERGNKQGLLRHDESGQVLVLVALAAVFLIAMVALAVDISHGLVVKHELQNAADASALVGAGTLFNPTPGPNWYNAELAASNSINMNKSDGQTLGTCLAEWGIWDISQTPPVFNSHSTATPDITHLPAVRVTVRRADGQNGGPVSTWFARIFGINSFPVAAVAVAVHSPHPGYVKPGPLLPVAISLELAKEYESYDNVDNTFIIGSSYHYGNSQAGQWTSFLSTNNSLSYIRELLQNGTTDTIVAQEPVNDPPCPNGGLDNNCIYIQPGTESAAYQSGPNPAITDYIGDNVLMPVVAYELSDQTHDWAPVVGFACVHIVSVDKSPEKIITAYFVADTYCEAKNTGGSGMNFGVLTPIRLVQ